MRFAAFLLFVCPICASGQCPLLDSETVLHPDATGKAVATLVFSTKPVALKITEFRPRLKGSATVMNTVRKLDTDSDSRVQLTVANLIEPGSFEASLIGEGITCPIISVRTVESYNVTIDSPGGEVVYAPDAKPVARIKNSDSIGYMFTTALLVDGEEKPLAGTLVLPAKGDADIDLSRVVPEASQRAGLAGFAHNYGLGWFTRLIATGTLKDQVKKAELVLQPAWTDSSTGRAPRLTLPLIVRQRFFSTGLQEGVNLFWIVAFLLIGGITSIWFNFGLPNSDGALRLRRKVAALCAKTGGTGEDLDSQWRTLICAKLQGIESDLRSATWAFPSFSGQLKDLQDTTAMIESWADIAYQVSIVLRETKDQIRSGIPPTVLFWIEEHCEDALNPIKSGLTNGDEIMAMRTELKNATDLLAALVNQKQIPDLEGKIQEREARVKADGSVRALNDAFPNGEFDQVVTAVSAVPNPKVIPVADYVQRDTNSLKLDLALEAALRKSALAPKAAAAAAGATARQPAPRDDYKRITDAWNRTMDYLRPDNPESLRMAHTLICEMHQDIYPQALHDEFAKADANGRATGIEILVNITDPKVNEAVRFSLRFGRDVVNTAAACNEMSCEWDFGDNSRKETGWEVFHAFDHEQTTVKTYPIKVWIRDIQGQEAEHMPLTRTIDVTPRVDLQKEWSVWKFWRLSPEAKLEFSRLVLVLIVAIAATLAVARDRVQTMSVLMAAGALIGIGFASDQIKKLLTAKSSEAK